MANFPPCCAVVQSPCFGRLRRSFLDAAATLPHEDIEKLKELVEDLPQGQFRLDRKYFNFAGSGNMFTPALVDLLGIPRVPLTAISRHRTRT